MFILFIQFNNIWAKCSVIFLPFYIIMKYGCLFCGMVLPVKTAKLISAYVWLIRKFEIFNEIIVD